MSAQHDSDESRLLATQELIRCLKNSTQTRRQCFCSTFPEDTDCGPTRPRPRPAPVPPELEVYMTSTTTTTSTSRPLVKDSWTENSDLLNLMVVAAGVTSTFVFVGLWVMLMRRTSGAGQHPQQASSANRWRRPNITTSPPPGDLPPTYTQAEHLGDVLPTYSEACLKNSRIDRCDNTAPVTSEPAAMTSLESSAVTSPSGELMVPNSADMRETDTESNVIVIDAPHWSDMDTPNVSSPESDSARAVEDTGDEQRPDVGASDESTGQRGEAGCS